MQACEGARNRRQETNVLIVSILPVVVVNLALGANVARYGMFITAGRDDDVYWYSFSNHYTNRAFTQP